MIISELSFLLKKKKGEGKCVSRLYLLQPILKNLCFSTHFLSSNRNLFNCVPSGGQAISQYRPQDLMSQFANWCRWTSLVLRRPCKIWATYWGRCVEKILAPKSKYIDTLKPGSKNCLGPSFQWFKSFGVVFFYFHGKKWFCIKKRSKGGNFRGQWNCIV